MTYKAFNEELWTFPCELNVKAMGLSEHPLEEIMCEIAKKYCSSVKNGDIASKASRTGKYRSVTLSVTLESKEKAEKLYLALGEREEIKWTL